MQIMDWLKREIDWSGDQKKVRCLACPLAKFGQAAVENQCKKGQLAADWAKKA
jgi:hypothetical protein